MSVSTVLKNNLINNTKKNENLPSHGHKQLYKCACRGYAGVQNFVIDASWSNSKRQNERNIHGLVQCKEISNIELQIGYQNIQINWQVTQVLTRTPSPPAGHLNAKAKSTSASIAPAPAIAPYLHLRSNQSVKPQKYIDQQAS